MSNNIEEDIEIVDKLKTDVEMSFGGWCNRLNIREKQAIENILNKYKKNQNIVDEIRGKINERKFELQQEYKEFEDDIRLNTLQEIYYMFEED